MSKIKVNSIEAATGTTVTLPSGQTLDLSSGTVTLPNSSVNLTTKVTGTLPVANGGTGLTTLGSASQVLRVNSGATALEFGTISSGANAGEVIQVLSATDSTERSTTSSSFVTASNTLSVTITPSASANKIFLIFDGFVGNTSANDTETYATIFRGATDLGAASNKGLAIQNIPTGSLSTSMGGMSFLDSPATTSATTYQVYFRQGSSGTAKLNLSNSKGSLTAMEIKG